jgi:hypothetical protein
VVEVVGAVQVVGAEEEGAAVECLVGCDPGHLAVVACPQVEEVGGAPEAVVHIVQAQATLVPGMATGIAGVRGDVPVGGVGTDIHGGGITIIGVLLVMVGGGTTGIMAGA